MWWIILFIILIGIIVFTLRRKRRNRHDHVGANNYSPMHPSPEGYAAASESPPEDKQETCRGDRPVAHSFPPHFIIMRILADNDQAYNGYELLQTLLANGFRFGKMNIFHRHAKTNGQGDILFSLASATEPGTFDLENMGKISCQGLTMFMQFDQQPNLRGTFDLMLETAKQLIDDLGGQIFDAQNRPLNQAVIENWQAQIRNYEDKKYSYDLFDGQDVRM